MYELAIIGGQVNWTTGIENYMDCQFIENIDLMKKFSEQITVPQGLGNREE
jgi:hypothetical protein